MEEAKKDGTDLRPIIQGVIEEFVRAQQIRAEPAYKAELLDERKRREDLERRMNDLVQENQRSRQMAEEAERSMSIRTSCSGWAWRKSTWPIARLKTTFNEAKTGG